MKLIDSRTERTTAATDVILSAAATGAIIYLQLTKIDGERTLFLEVSRFDEAWGC